MTPAQLDTLIMLHPLDDENRVVELGTVTASGWRDAFIHEKEDGTIATDYQHGDFNRSKITNVEWEYNDGWQCPGCGNDGLKLNDLFEVVDNDGEPPVPIHPEQLKIPTT